MKFDGRKLYEVYDRKTGRMLASGDVASCARKLEIGMPGFRLAAPAVTEFKVHFETFMASYNRMTELLDEMPKGMADKMKKAVKSAVEQMGVQDETVND